MTERVMLVAGETSGDIHAGNLLAELNRIRPALEPFGVGGERLGEAGLEVLAHTDELAHMGLIEVVRELPRLRTLMGRLVEECRRRTPKIAVLVDSPDFNLRLAAKLGDLGVPVVLYVSPQLWAWRRGRVRTVRRLAREVLCILPFEVEFYRANGVDAEYVGHPLVDEISRIGLLEGVAEVDPGRIALLPGSRSMEVRQLLPAMLEGVRLLDPDVVREALLVEAPGVGAAVDAALAGHEVDPRLRRIRGPDRRRELATCCAAWTASGTATLECALLDVPMAVGYRLQPLSYRLARILVRVPHIGLVNLIAGHRAAPELIQSDWSGPRLARAATALMGPEGDRQRAALATVRSRLGGPGASRCAAEAVARIMDEA